MFPELFYFAQNISHFNTSHKSEFYLKPSTVTLKMDEIHLVNRLYRPKTSGFMAVLLKPIDL